MTTTRRTFLKTAPVAALAFATPSACAPPVLRVRKNIKNLDKDSQEIKDLVKGLTEMANAQGRRNLKTFAEIHGKIGKEDTNKCQHGSALFLPWHRAYLHCFELIVAKLSDNPDFALPYWDWENDHTLPALFDGPIPALDNLSRKSKGKTFNPVQIKTLIGPNIIKDILDITSFSLFAGGMPDDLDRETGHLEKTPHGFIHYWVDGDMATGGCPIDPVFWLHHCNIDRIWDLWTRRPKHTHPDGPWLKTTFPEFCDGNGDPFADPITVADTLARKWGYCYEGFKDLADSTPANSAQTLASKGFDVTDDNWRDFKRCLAAILWRFPDSVKMIKTIAEADTPVSDQPPARDLQLSIRLGENPKLSPFLWLQVYLTQGELPVTRLGPDNPGFVGAIPMHSLFGHQHAEVASHGRAVVMNATPALRRITKERQSFQPEYLAIQLTAVTIEGLPWEGDPKLFRPEEVRLDLVTSAR